jgi:hypothetical protein
VSNKHRRERRPALPKITSEQLTEIYKRFDAAYNSGDRSQWVANSIVGHYLGGKWLDVYAHSASPKAIYMKVDINAPPQEKTLGLVRYWEFAETLFNLQNVEGIEAPLDQLFHGEVESGCAEIDIARMMVLYNVKFRFIVPTRTLKSDYDFEITYPDGFRVPADAKCKLESTQLDAASITDSLRKARKQLPDDRLSVVLIKVPEKWIMDTELAQQIVHTAADYMRQSNHIASVKFYSPILMFFQTYVRRHHALKEISNPKFTERNWDIFLKEVRTPDGMPPWWTRFYPELRLALYER